MGVVHWIAVVIGIFVVSLVFLPMMGAFDIVKNSTLPGMPEQAARVMGLIEISFYLVPIILIIGLILYGLATSERRRFESTRDTPEF